MGSVRGHLLRVGADVTIRFPSSGEEVQGSARDPDGLTTPSYCQKDGESGRDVDTETTLKGDHISSLRVPDVRPKKTGCPTRELHHVRGKGILIVRDFRSDDT